MIRFGIFTASLVGALGFASPANAATIQFTATLSGAAEVPAVDAGNATGMAVVTLDDTADTLSWNITYQSLTGPVTLAHFHGPADAGTTNTPRITIMLPDAGATSPITGSAPISEAFQTELLNGFWYLNLHTAANPNGEIRGQVLRQLDAGTTDGGDASPDATPDAPPDGPRPDSPPDAPPDRDGAGGTGATGGAGGRGGSMGAGATGGAGGRGGSMGAGATGGAGGRGGTSGRGGSGGSSAPPGDDDDGCGCRTVGESSSAAGLIGLALAGLMLSRRMAERRSRRENERK
jgi:hypothetical protein